jgi:hypothetical protein
MTIERDIIIERLEQKLTARDAEIQKMHDSLKESVINEIEKKFTDKMKVRESTLDEIRIKFGEKVNQILEMNKSLQDSFEQLKSRTLVVDADKLDRIERRVIELSSAYDGVMAELLDQKSLIHELVPKKPRKDELKPRQQVKEDAGSVEKPDEKSKPKSEYIIADTYVPKGDKKKEQIVIEAEEKAIKVEELPEEKTQKKKTEIKKSERVREGVEIYETPKKR